MKCHATFSFSLQYCIFYLERNFLILRSLLPEAEFKEIEPPLEFKPGLKYGWFHLKLYSIQDLSRHLIETGFLWI